RIALAFCAWSSDKRQELLVPWTLIDGLSTAQQFAAALLHGPGPVPGYTSISGAIDYAGRLMASCEFPSDRWVIDISGEGFNNDGRAVTEARDEAVAAGITINGLPIVRGERNIVSYYGKTSSVARAPSSPLHTTWQASAPHCSENLLRRLH